jgi:hypothetical protein
MGPPWHNVQLAAFELLNIVDVTIDEPLVVGEFEDVGE